MTPLSLIQTFKAVSLAFIFLLISLTASSQTISLERKIAIPGFNGNARVLIEKISKDEGIIFSYTDEINLNFDVDFSESEIIIQDFLDKILLNRPISYKAVGNKILLFPSGNIEQKQTEPKSKVLKQTVRGTVYDFDTKQALPGVTIIIPNYVPIIATTTDTDGRYRIENVPIGRINLQFSFIGFKTSIISNIEVNSAKEVILNIEMHESSVKLDEVVATSGRKKGEALNELSVLSSRSISIEETKRYTAGMDDPARMVTSYAGVTASDGGSDIIVRGNSPKYMQWHLDGVEITSPYHMDDQNGAIGTLTALNKSLMGTSDFYTGAFSPEYGNVLSNIMNLRLRTGNNEKFEAAFGFGLMGTDLTIEGAFKKGYRGSYLINYRYSSVALIKDIGLLGDIDGVVNYQDATFKLFLPTRKAGTFTIFGLGRLSGFTFENLAPSGLSTPGLITDASVLKDYDKAANLSNLAITNT